MSADYGRQGPFGRAVDAAIRRDNARPRPGLHELCGALPDNPNPPGVFPCGLALGHVERAGTPHRNVNGREWADVPTPPDGT